MKNIKIFLATQLRRLSYFRHNLRLVVVWLAAFIFFDCLLWGVTLSILHSEWARAERDALKSAAALADGYAIQLEQAIQQIDQVTLRLKYEWEKASKFQQLEDQVHEGIYPPSAHLYASIVDRKGKVLTSTLTKENAPNVANQDYFHAQEMGQATGLFIGKPSTGLLSGKTVVRFSRRLNSPKGEFDGVVLASVEPEYFISLTDAAKLGTSDFVSVKRTDGALLTKIQGGTIGGGPPQFQATPVFQSVHGVMRMEGHEFIDGTAHFVAWHRLKNYPLMTVVGLQESAVFAPYRDKEYKYYLFAMEASIVLFLSMLSSLFIYGRLTWRKQQAAQVKEAFRLATDVAREGFYMLRAVRDHTGKIIDFVVKDCNERGAAYYGKTREELIGTKFSDYPSMEDNQEILEMYSRALETGYHESEDKVSASNPLMPSWVHRKIMRSGNGLAVTLRDISDIKEHEQQLADMANRDAVTLLPNRHWLTHYLPTATKKAAENKTLLAVLFIDLDDFKNINDTLGHDAGDELLRAVAQRLKSGIRPQDNVARLGGDEFTVVLEQIDSKEEIEVIAERIVAALSEPFSFRRGTSYPVLGSIGISIFPQDGIDSNTLLKHADVAMYASKTNGKGLFTFYTPELSASLIDRLNKEQALRRALDQDEFVLYYQPRVDTFSGALRGLEALIRWNNPDRPIVMPLEFIPLAEETGLIVPLGEMVIRKSCEQLAQWKAQHLPVVPISINVSARQFNQGNLSAVFSSCMAHYDIEPSLLEIELTESSMLGDGSVVTTEVAALEALGIKLLIDDFGTGYSSLSQLQRMEMDAVKVDRAFTGNLNSEKGEAFYMAILSMAHVLDMTVVAEGVETEEQLRTLQALSCNQVQGYLISPPVPASSVPDLLQKRFLFPTAEANHHSLAT